VSSESLVKKVTDVARFSGGLNCIVLEVKLEVPGIDESCRSTEFDFKVSHEVYTRDRFVKKVTKGLNFFCARRKNSYLLELIHRDGHGCVDK